MCDSRKSIQNIVLLIQLSCA